MPLPQTLKRLHIVSPHQDDAAFSLALTLAEFAASGWAVLIVNCFTVSEYQPLGPPLSVETVGQMRHNEDLNFLAQIAGVQVEDLGFQDAPLRLGLQPNDVCLSRANPSSLTYDPAEEKLKQSFLELPAAELIFVPLAIGSHIDHLRARNAAISAFQAKPIVFYQDLPYAGRFRDPDGEIAMILSVCKLPCLPMTLSAGSYFEKKLSYISAYNSQASKAELTEIATYPGGERLWVTEKALPLMSELTLAALPSLSFRHGMKRPT